MLLFRFLSFFNRHRPITWPTFPSMIEISS